MPDDDLERRLSSIETVWTSLFKAHGGEEDARQSALKNLLLRYYGAAYRYLLAIVRDPVEASELTQDFAVRFLRGDFRRANPERGRFRDFLKTSLRHLAQDYWRAKKAKPPGTLGAREAEAAAPDPEDLDKPFLDKWREELLSRTWAALAEEQATSGTPYHTALVRKSSAPATTSAQLASQLSAELGQTFSEDGIRQIVHRARKRFAELLVAEVANSVETDDADQIEQELIELNLLGYCKDALARRKKDA